MESIISGQRWYRIIEISWVGIVSQEHGERGKDNIPA
jgi:hypothetical protein